MKITLTWTPSGAGQPTNFVLADSPTPIPMTNFRINGSRAIQEAQFFRAAGRSFYDRGNRRTEIRFDTTRQFADQISAETFVSTHGNEFPGRVLVTLMAGRSGGGATASRYLANAVVEAIGSSLIGCTTRHSYRITGGIMTNTPS